MAALEPDRLVVRVVYAGAPMAGKTATVRALMPLLKGPGAERLVSSPNEHRGRTAFFDWADYEGGAFEGRPIHCQIASAPGQVALSDRRELLIRGADAVILVVDSQNEALERTLQCYEEMAPWLEEAGRDAPIRVLLQCNKQDLPGSLGALELSRALGLPFGRDVYPTSARTTKGLRAAFVAGVRAAVERARLLLDRGIIAHAPEIASAEELLERMQRGGPVRGAAIERNPAIERAAAAPRGPAVQRSTIRRSPPAAKISPAPPSVTAPHAVQHRDEPARPERRMSARSVPERTRLGAARVRPRRSPNEPRTRVEPAAAEPEQTERPARPSATRATTALDRREPAPRPALGEPADVPAREPGRSLPMRPEAAPPSSRPAAKDWTPGSGPRPAVMPASAYYALVGPPVSRAEVEAWGIPEPGLPAKPESAPALDVRARTTNEAPAREQPAQDAKATARARPAVMPSSAYFAEQAREAAAREAAAAARSAAGVGGALASEGETETGDATPRAAKDLAAVIGRKRPAVMPASAYFALLRRMQEDAGSAQPEPVATPTLPAVAELQPEASAAPAPSEAPPPAAADAAPAIRLARPAVIPMAAWRSGHWTTRATPVRAAAPRPRQREREPAKSRPAVMPASAWRAMEREAAEHAARATLDAESPRLAPEPAANDDAPSPESGLVQRSFEVAPPLGADEVMGVPRLPGTVAPRSMWPRSTWRQLAPLITKPGLPRRDLYGRFIAELAPGWYARSLESAPDLKSARRSLARAVLRQRSLGDYLSGPRCLALTEEPDRFWVWQIVYRVPTLAVQLGRMLDSGEEPSAVADVLLEVATGYLQAREKFAAAPEPLPLSLQALSAQEGKLVYAGLLPKSDSILPPPPVDGGAALEEALRRKWPGALSPGIDAGAVVAELQRKAVGRLPDPIVEIIRGVLIRH